MEIQDKVAIITGASTGIGRETARLFAAHGARLALVARSQDKLEALAAELPNARAFPADLAQVETIAALVARIHDHFGAVDVLVNNAGRAMHQPIAQASVQTYRELLDLNVVAVLALMQAVLPPMRQQPGGGVIVNISSGLSKRIVPGVGPYASSKYALNALTLTARQELAHENIRVCLMLPGRTADTQFALNALGRVMDPQNYASGDSPQHVAAKILEAVQTEAPETYANSIRPAT